jgi:hypothetical protein
MIYQPNIVEGVSGCGGVAFFYAATNEMLLRLKMLYIIGFSDDVVALHVNWSNMKQTRLNMLKNGGLAVIIKQNWSALSISYFGSIYLRVVSQLRNHESMICHYTC